MRARPFAVVFAAVAASFFSSPAAVACGGTFCDGGPMPMAVDQKGENVLFVMDGQTVEAHIQIQYQGGAARFAWVIPVPALPQSIHVGSQRLFTNLLQATVPTYYTSTQNVCQPAFCPGGATGAGGGAGSGPSGSAGSGGSGDGGGGPKVVFKAIVGAFDVVVLQGGTSAEVIAWLDANQYQQNPLAKPILEDYLAKGYLFVALKLTGGAGTDEIHPIVVKYAGDKPCVPLKLTSIAAVEDMEVRTFFLAKGRVVPTNYKHLVLNQARVDWTAASATFLPAVTQAANSPVANGHGFVTEYAGANIVGGLGLYDPSWDAAAFPGLKPSEVIPALAKQGLVSCSGGAKCTYGHPQIQGLLEEFLPPPAGVSDAAYYGCLACYASSADLTKWDGAAFGKALIERVIEPGVHAQDLLSAWPYVTRLLTTISPAEMTEDPEFHEDDTLPPDGAQLYATRDVACNGQSAMVLPGGTTIALVNGAWPAWGASMPWAERIEEYPVGKPPIVLVDNKAIIEQQVNAWTAAQGWPPPQPTCPPGAGGGGGSAGKGGGSAGKGGGSAGFGGNGIGGSAAGNAGGASGAGAGTSAGKGGSGAAGVSGNGAAGKGGDAAAGKSGAGQSSVGGQPGGAGAGPTNGTGGAPLASAAASPDGGGGCAMSAPTAPERGGAFAALGLSLLALRRRARR